MKKQRSKNNDQPETSGPANDPALVMSNLDGDWLNFFLLLLLYIMQGLLLGVSGVIPIITQSRGNVSYKEQAIFSLAYWPFSIKLLWAPLVDAIYLQRFGRRKSWLIPVQYVSGMILFLLAKNFDDLMPETEKPNIRVLTGMFFIINFLAATQDIAVDGWALTMLNKHNVGYASTCNSAGQTIGTMIGSTMPVLLSSEEFCNKYIRITSDTGGIVSMKSILYFLGAVFLMITTLIAIFKKEKDHTAEIDHTEINVVQNYLLLWDILKIPSVQKLSLSLLTAKVGFATMGNLTSLKLIDAGVLKDDIIITETFIQVMQILTPFAVSKYTSGPKPMSVYLKLTPTRLFFNLVFVVLIYFTPTLITFDGVVKMPMYYFIMLVVIFLIHDALMTTMFVANMAFFSRISDSRFGGTYMTLLNTIANLGFRWTSTVSLGMVDLLTFKECSSDAENKCSTQYHKETCQASGGNCILTIDGYYVETVFCFIVGFVWYAIFKTLLKDLQTKSPSHWLVNIKPKQPVTENSNNTHAVNVS